MSGGKCQSFVGGEGRVKHGDKAKKWTRTHGPGNSEVERKVGHTQHSFGKKQEPTYRWGLRASLLEFSRTRTRWKGAQLWVFVQVYWQFLSRTLADKVCTTHFPEVLDDSIVPFVAVLVLRLLLQSLKVQLRVTADKQLQLLRSEEAQGLTAHHLVETPVMYTHRNRLR